MAHHNKIPCLNPFVVLDIVLRITYTVSKSTGKGEGNMATKELKAVTPVGEFSRSTKSSYTHVVVRECGRAKEALANKSTRGVGGRWAKDNGYAVTWHNSKLAAERAADAKYCYDWSAKVVGIYEVGA
jgi:hypothetical protein